MSCKLDRRCVHEYEAKRKQTEVEKVYNEYCWKHYKKAPDCEVPALFEGGFDLGRAGVGSDKPDPDKRAEAWDKWINSKNDLEKVIDVNPIDDFYAGWDACEGKVGNDKPEPQESKFRKAFREHVNHPDESWAWIEQEFPDSLNSYRPGFNTALDLALHTSQQSDCMAQMCSKIAALKEPEVE